MTLFNSVLCLSCLVAQWLDHRLGIQKTAGSNYSPGMLRQEGHPA